MVSRDNFYVGYDLDEAFEEFWDIFPFFQLNFRNSMLHISQQNQEFWMSLYQDLSQLLQQSRHLGGHMYSLVRQGHFPAEMKVSND
jgi:hypothetical protein